MNRLSLARMFLFGARDVGMTTAVLDLGRDGTFELLSVHDDAVYFDIETDGKDANAPTRLSCCSPIPR